MILLCLLSHLGNVTPYSSLEVAYIQGYEICIIITAKKIAQEATLLHWLGSEYAFMDEWTADNWHAILIGHVLELVRIVSSVVLDVILFGFVVADSFEQTCCRRINFSVDAKSLVILVERFNSVAVCSFSAG